MSNPYRGTIKVRFADTDANGHAFFGNYFVFADEVLGDYWAELGWDVSDVVNQEYLTFTVNANMDFLGESLNHYTELSVPFLLLESCVIDLSQHRSEFLL